MTPRGPVTPRGTVTPRGPAVDARTAAIDDRSRVVTWPDLDRRADAVARRVAAAGIPAGGLVALPGGPSIERIAGILGVVRAGGVAAPVAPRLTATERAEALALLRPAATLTIDDEGEPSVLTGVDGRVLSEPGVVVMTSGTTAAPRGVILSDAALRASAAAWLAALPPATGWLLALGLGHVAGLGVVWRAMAAGVPIRIAAQDDASAILAALAAGAPCAASHVSLVPAQLTRLLDAAGAAPPPAGVRAVLLGGGTIEPALVTRAIDAGWPVVPTYGLSEAASGVTALATDEAREVPASAGRPLPGIEVSIEDPDDDGVGEIIVRSPAAFAGYLDGPARSPRDPVRTGDLCRPDDAGRVYVVDRRTDRIVRGGENIAPSEVERVLRAHPAIGDAAVVARPDALWGQVPVAAIVARPGATLPDDAALVRHCRASLSGFKVPVGFVRVEALPRTTGGKLRRSLVRAMIDGPLPGALERPDGVRIGWRTTGTGPVTLLLLHGTLSNARQLDRLAAELARPGDVTIRAIDRRASGTSRVTVPGPVPIATHVADLVAVMDHLGLERAMLAGLSYGGVLALEVAARHPERVVSVAAWEPPYGPVADPATQRRFAVLADATAAAHRTGGAAGAAETFLRAVAGDGAWDRLPDRGRAFLAGEGDGALADAALTGVDAGSPGRIRVPVVLLTGDTSEPFYAPIASALAERIPGARRTTLAGMGHAAPLTDPVPVAAAIRDALGLGVDDEMEAPR